MILQRAKRKKPISSHAMDPLLKTDYVKTMVEWFRRALWIAENIRLPCPDLLWRPKCWKGFPEVRNPVRVMEGDKAVWVIWATSIGISPVNAQALWSLISALSFGSFACLLRDLLGLGRSSPVTALFWLWGPESSVLVDVDGDSGVMRCIHKRGISWHLSAKRLMYSGSTLATSIIVCSRSRSQTCRQAQKAAGTGSFPRASPSSVISCTRLALRCSGSGVVTERPEEDIPEYKKSVDSAEEMSTRNRV